jgi:hypothetical protein
VSSVFAAIDHPKNKNLCGFFAGETDCISKVELNFFVTSTPRHFTLQATLRRTLITNTKQFPPCQQSKDNKRAKSGKHQHQHQHHPQQ